MVRHPLIDTLMNLTGNARAGVLTEPIVGIPYNLVLPYASVYMIELGLNDLQIGSIASIGLVVQVVLALMGGAITDRLGRRLTTFIFDVLSLTVPCIIWGIAQDYRYFLIASIFNGMWRITSTSWTCLMVEDTNPDHLVHFFSWIYIAGLVSAFFAPVAGIFINRFGLVPAVRGLYLFAAAMLTVKFVALNHFVVETTRGRQRMEETRHQSILGTAAEYPGVLKKILRTPTTLRIMGLMLILNIANLINGTFWSILVTKRLNLPAENLALFAFVKSGILLILYFTLVPRINAFHFRRPFLVGLGAFAASQALLISMPELNYPLLVLSIVLEAFALASINPLLDSLTTLSINPEERARIMSLVAVMIILGTTPFGWIAGSLSEANRILPFLLNLGLFACGAVLILLTTRKNERADFKV